jgi:PAS domain S-box-containing protein
MFWLLDLDLASKRGSRAPNARRGKMKTSFKQAARPWFGGWRRDVLRKAMFRASISDQMGASETLVRECGVGMLILDVAGRFLERQPDWESYTGQRASDAADRGYLNAVLQSERASFAERWSARLADSQTFTEYAHLYRALDGTHRRCALRAAPLPNSAESAAGWVVAFVDVDDEYRAALAAEKGLRIAAERQAQFRLTLLAAALSHVISNMLQGVTAYVELSQVAGHMQRKRKRLILASVDRCVNLLARLRVSSQAAPVALTDHVVGQISEGMTASWALLCPAPIELRIGPTTEFGRGRVSSELLRAMTGELITNSVEAMSKEGGLIELRVGSGPITEQELAGALPLQNVHSGEWCYLEVADSGRGMEPDIQSSAFEPFFSTKFLGRGLGLNTVLAGMRNVGGLVLSQSTPGLGTKVRLFFPLTS